MLLIESAAVQGAASIFALDKTKKSSDFSMITVLRVSGFPFFRGKVDVVSMMGCWGVGSCCCV